MNNSEWPAVLAGASGYPDPAFAAVMTFLLAGLVGLRIFHDASAAMPSARLGMIVLILGAAATGCLLVAGSSTTLFGRVAGILACTLAMAVAVGGFLIVRGLGRKTTETPPSP